MEDNVANLLFADKSPRPIGVTRIIKDMASLISDIDQSFAVSNMLSLLSIVNIYSEEEEEALQVSCTFPSQGT